MKHNSRMKNDKPPGMNLVSNSGPLRISRRAAVKTALVGVAGLSALSKFSHLELNAAPALQETGSHQSKDPGDKLRIATCQFPVSGDAAANASYIRKFMHEAADAGAHLLHTSEACLAGYAGIDLPSLQNYDWEAIRKETTGLRESARQLHLWLVLGSAHFLDENTKPTNCLYLINPEGKIVDRYDKCFCTEG